MTDFNKSRFGAGTREWSEHSLNIGQGCSHSCLYCYARYNAITRWKKISTPDEWTKERIVHLPRIAYPKRSGVIMFPTTHDITPYYLEYSILTLKRVLEAGNNVLIVTKPHRDCIRRLCAELKDFKHQILFRFTITTMSPSTSRYWEPGAPLPEERIECLVHAHMQGYQTSVSAEPLLGGAATGIELFNAVAPYVSDQVWFGKLNDPWRRVQEIDTLPDCRQRVTAIEKAQRPHIMLDLYNALKAEPKAAWKDSIRQVVERHIK